LQNPLAIDEIARYQQMFFCVTERGLLGCGTKPVPLAVDTFDS
jgi:hypothetical protein